MRIGLEVSYAFMGRGGIDRYAYGLVSALLARDDENRYLPFTMFAPYRRSGLHGAPIARPVQRKLAMAQVELLRRIWSRFDWPPVDVLTGRVDVVHALHHFAVPTRRARLIATVHDLSFEHPELRVGSSSTFARDTRRAVATADLVVVPSQFTKRELTEQYAVADERIRVVYPGVDAALWSSDGGAPVGEPYFLAVGQVEPRKNLLELAQALRLARDRFHLKHRLVVAGRTGHGGAGIVEQLRGLPEVEYLGFVPDSELRRLLAGATAFVYPSRYEGFGMSLLEAMAAGVPVVSAAAGSLPEVVGDAGLLVDLYDPDGWAEALARTALDEDLRRSLVEKGRSRVGTFTWPRAADEIAAVYAELAA
jgi:glycosyltransferase involved in cell wall biosynthesis